MWKRTTLGYPSENFKVSLNCGLPNTNISCCYKRLTARVLSSVLFFYILVALLAMNVQQVQSAYAAEILPGDEGQPPRSVKIRKKINFLPNKNRRRTASPPGWEGYDGTIYNPERGYGWLTDLSGTGRDRGGNAKITLHDGVRRSLADLDRHELASWQGFEDSGLNVFRIDLPDGWYKVTCSSVDPNSSPLPLRDLRCFKCRGNDVVFAGAGYGAPLAVGGDNLVEGAGIVEIINGHLRIVVGDPAYGGWTWSYQGPWYKGWLRWVANDYGYADGWYQIFTRMVDPGFHSLRVNSIEIEQVDSPIIQKDLIFRDFFDRNDGNDLNAGLAEDKQWLQFRSGNAESLNAELYRASIKVENLNERMGVISMLQKGLTSENGRVRYSTRVSLFSGHGSKKLLGKQEAGILILADEDNPTGFNSTFIGVALDSGRKETIGWLRYRVGNGISGYQTDVDIPDTELPFKITEGEYEIIVDHDLQRKLITNIRINGEEMSGYFDAKELSQRARRGLLGLRSMIENDNSGVNPKQYYWYFSVERIN